MNKPSRTVVIITAASLFFTGCAVTGPSNPSNGEVQTSQAPACQYDYAASAGLGAAGGALAGLALSNRKNQGQNAAIGALAGAAVALLVTSYLEKRCKALMAAKAEMGETQLNIASVKVAAPSSQTEEGVQVTATDPGMFPEGSAELSSRGLHDMEALAQSFAGTDRRILVVGHTDSVGSPEANLKLSEARAQTVARLFTSAGIPASSIYYKGAGETRPIDTNDTAQGRANNRRVEVLELQSESGILAFDDALDSNPALLHYSVRKRGESAQASVSAPSSRPGKSAVAKPPPKVSKQVSGKQLAHSQAQFHIDFGGVPVDGTGATLASYVGPGAGSNNGGSGLSLISSAIAEEPENASLQDTACIADSFKQRGVVISLATGQPVGRVGDHAKGLFGKTWTDTVNGHLVGLTNVSVLRGTGQVNSPPELYVFANYKGGDQKPTFSIKGDAQAYIGEKGLLYRVFYRDEAQPIRCMDVVFSHTNIEAVYGQMYYKKDGRVYAVLFRPKTKPSE